jgi:hypothetical protein
MVVRAKLSALKRDHWYELIVRFALGGLATVTAGVVADIWGPTVGGLFLAFPAIFCASTLIEKHERARKKEKGLEGKSAVRMLPRWTQLAPGLEALGSPPFAPLSGSSQKIAPQHPW